MKKAFTMIELIFVIVILGILAAVALPKFIGVAGQAHEGNLKSFTGTLNRTVAPTLWSESISAGKNGDISYTNLTESNITTYVDLPKEIDKVDLSKCNDPKKDIVSIQIDENVTGSDYVITCRDGNANQSPVFKLFKCSNNPCGISDGTEINSSTSGVKEVK